MNLKLKDFTTPQGYLEQYFNVVYGGLENVNEVYKRELSLAFHAGVEAAFKFIDDAIYDDTSEENVITYLGNFRKLNASCATDLNLSRFKDQ
jgi:hypothetical protein